MAAEIPRYLDLVGDRQFIPMEIGANVYTYQICEAESFWQDCGVQFPALSKLVESAFTLPASSGAAELAVFSRFKNTFDLQHLCQALSDYTEGAMMLQMNEIKTHP